MNEIGHGGNLAVLAARARCGREELLDFSVNLNPAGPPPGAFECCFRSFDRLSEYPEPYAESAVAVWAKKLGRPVDEVAAGNGSNELLRLLPRVAGAKRAVVVTPGYLEYARGCELAGLPVAEFRGEAAQLGGFVKPGDLVMLGNPNNPTGAALPGAVLRQLALEHPEVLFLIDEAFIEFVGEEESLVGCSLPNLMVSRSLTKFYAMPGLRMGLLCGPARILSQLRAVQGPWTVSTPAQEMMKFLAALGPEYAESGRRETAALREALAAKLAEIPHLKVWPSQANYLLVNCMKNGIPERLLGRHRIAVRECGDYPGLGRAFFRVAVRRADENARLVEALSRELGGAVPYLKVRRKTPALMLQGTCSNAGKSILTAAFCRVLLQEGIAVAPFKAQNMALNSFVTPGGGEIGRAQAVQAEACRIDPDVRMNPILLKPSSDVGSQLIVHGRALGHYKVREYFQRKRELWHEVTKAYDSLSSDYDAIVLEGAGSPGEVNLKSGDLVNMRMAEYAAAPVLLAGDIDRGGVYAAFTGTYATLEMWERKLLKGFIVNKFRGDPSLLGNAHSYVELVTGRPVVGVIDYLRDLGLPEEDSVNFSFIRPVPKEARTLDVVLIQLGHVANFTDFAPLEIEPDVTLRKISRAEEFGDPDVVILPGSKSVADDLEMLRRAGFAELLEAAHRRGAHLVGICGGLQMLGARLLDPGEVESRFPDLECLNFLPLVTEMRREKTLRRTRAAWDDAMELSGYEIHHGETVCTDPSVRVVRDAEGRAIGFERGRIFTSYLHGVFDDDAFRRCWLDRVRIANNWSPKEEIVARYGMEESLERLACHLRERIDMEWVLKQMGMKSHA